MTNVREKWSEIGSWRLILIESLIQKFEFSIKASGSNVICNCKLAINGNKCYQRIQEFVSGKSEALELGRKPAWVCREKSHKGVAIQQLQTIRSTLKRFQLAFSSRCCECQYCTSPYSRVNSSRSCSAIPSNHGVESAARGTRNWA